MAPRGSLFLLLASTAFIGAFADPSAILTFNNEAQQAVRDYGIPSQISSRVSCQARIGKPCALTTSKRHAVQLEACAVTRSSDWGTSPRCAACLLPAAAVAAAAQRYAKLCAHTHPSPAAVCRGARGAVPGHQWRLFGSPRSGW